MKPGQILRWSGIFLLTAIMLWVVGTVLLRDTGGGPSQKIQIRLAHWNLESGLREAFDAVAREYMRRNPGVEVIQVPVPGKVYQTWLQTGQAGGTVPDILALAGPSDEMLANYFYPLSEEIKKPNPHNAGTPLEGVPWRDTFADGLSRSAGLETLQSYYSVPVAVMTVRMYYNKDLWQEIFGNHPVPANFAGFLEICEEVGRYAERTGRPVSAIAGSKFTAEILFTHLFRGQTQKLTLAIDRMQSLAFPQTPTALAFQPGHAKIDGPEIRNGLEIMRKMAGFMQSGFLQLDREDAIFQFGQSRALMLPTGVWDFGSIVEQSTFPIGVFPIPFPKPGDETFGEGVIGETVEGVGWGLDFFVSAGSPHRDTALDFLKFLTSQPGAQLFASVSKWPPSVVGVEIAPESKAFEPVRDGFPPGLIVAPLVYGRGELYRIHAQNAHLLFGPNGSVDAYLAAVGPQFEAAVHADLALLAVDQNDSVRRMDTVLAGLEAMKSGDRERLSALWQAQNAQESHAIWLESEIAEEQP